MNDISVVRGISAAATAGGDRARTVVSSTELPETPLHPLCWKGLKSMSIESLFPVQKICANLMINRFVHPQFSPYDCDLCVSAPTGSGKSLAYLLPIVHGLADRRTPVLRALIVLPTRDLALQVAQVASQFAGLRVHCFVGQNSMAQERAELMNPESAPDIAVATIGRLVDHLVIGSLDLSLLRWLVVDEADRMLSKSDLDKWSLILSSVPDSTHRLLFSATMTSNPLKLNKLKLTRPMFVSVGLEGENATMALPETITHRYVVAPNKSMKVRCLLKVLELAFAESDDKNPLISKRANRCLILCRTNENVQSLISLLKSFYKTSTTVVPQPFSGNMTGKAREKLLVKFAAGQVNCLVSTDVITRGIDVPDIDIVINYDAPKHATTYIHRSGRTGRAGKSGLVVSMTEAKEMRHFRKEIIDSDVRIKKSIKRFNMDFSTVMTHGELEAIASEDDDDEVVE